MNKSNCKADVAKAQQELDVTKKTYTVELKTNKGTIKLGFFPDKAPGHVKNFLALSKIGFYDGLTFHRVIEGFMIQGGCPLGSGTSSGGYTIKAEFNSRKFERGVLGMARTSDPNSAGSQIYIMLGAAPHLNGQYTAFGRVVSGMEVVDTIRVGDRVKTAKVK